MTESLNGFWKIVMFDLAGLPGVISERITGLEWKHENIGMSGSSILVFEKMVLKIEKTGRSSEHEKTLLAWLENKLPVPKIIETTDSDGYSFLLMSKLDGDMPVRVTAFSILKIPSKLSRTDLKCSGG